MAMTWHSSHRGTWSPPAGALLRPAGTGDATPRIRAGDRGRVHWNGEIRTLNVVQVKAGRAWFAGTLPGLSLEFETGHFRAVEEGWGIEYDVADIELA